MQNNYTADVMVPGSAPVPVARFAEYDAYNEQGVDLRDYWQILAKRKWWFLGVLSTVMALTLLAIMLMSPVYMVTTTLQIIQDNPSAIMGGSGTDPLGALTGSSELDRFYETQYKILQSASVAYGLIDILNLKEHKSYKLLEENNPNDPPELIRKKYAESLLASLKIEPVKKSFLVNISFSSTDKNLAQKVPEAIQQVYLKLSMSTRQQSYTMLREWLDGELTRLGRKLENSERNVYESGQKNDFLSLEENQHNVVVQKYVELNRLLTTAQSEKTIKEAQYRQIKEKGHDAPLITNNPLIQQLRNQLIGMESQMSGSGQIFGNNYPERKVITANVKELRERINQEIRRLESSVRADYEAATRAEALLREDFDLQKSKIIDMENDLVQHHVLKRDLQTNQTLYEGLLARMKEASIASTMVASNVSVITASEMPYKPWKPKPRLYLALAFIIGSLGGLATVFLLEYFDKSIKSTEEVEKVSRLPILGLVPFVDMKGIENDRKELGLITHSEPSSIVSEAFFHIRTAIMLSSSEAPPQVITVTSPNPGEGKTTTALNMAVTLAGLDHKCLIMDCDLRKPRMHGVFQLQNQQGLTHYLTGHAKLEDIIQPTAIHNLYVMTAGPKPPNPHELLASSMLANLIKHLRKEYDHIVIDSPPVIGFADARFLSAHADGVVLMFRHHSTTVEAARLAVQLMSRNNTRILGCILTMAQKDRMGCGGYNGYYRHYHKYYKRYYSSNGDGREDASL